MGREGRGRPTPHLSSTYVLVSQVWEGCYLPSTHPWVGIQVSNPLFRGWQGAALSGSPGATLLMPLGLLERGMREEVPNTCESEHSLDEQRLSMVLELSCRKAGGKERR